MNDDDSGVHKPLVDNFAKFQEYTDKISENIPILANYVEALKEYKSKMGTEQDTKSMRTRMNNEIVESNELIKQTLDLIQDLEDLKFKNKKDIDNKKKMLRRLNNSFEEYYEEFTKLIKEIHSNEKRFIDLQQSIFNASVLSEQSATLPAESANHVNGGSIYERSSLIENTEVHQVDGSPVIAEENEVHIDDVVEDNAPVENKESLVHSTMNETVEINKQSIHAHAEEENVHVDEENVHVDQEIQAPAEIFEQKEEINLVGEENNGEISHQQPVAAIEVKEEVLVEDVQQAEENNEIQNGEILEEKIEEGHMEPVEEQYQKHQEENNEVHNEAENVAVEAQKEDVPKLVEEEVEKENVADGEVAAEVQPEEIPEQKASVEEEVAEVQKEEIPEKKAQEEHVELVEEQPHEPQNEQKEIQKEVENVAVDIQKEEIPEEKVQIAEESVGENKQEEQFIPIAEKNASIVRKNESIIKERQSVVSRNGGSVLQRDDSPGVLKSSIRINTMQRSVVREDVKTLKESIVDARNNLELYASIIQERERQMATVKRISSETNLLEAEKDRLIAERTGDVGVVINDTSHSQTIDRPIRGSEENKKKKSSTTKIVIIILLALLVLGGAGAGIAWAK